MRARCGGLALAVALLAAQRAEAQCTVTPYIVVDAQSCDWTAGEQPLTIAGSGSGAQLIISQTLLTDGYNTASTGNGSLYSLMTFPAGTTFLPNAQVGLFLNIPGGPAVDAACGANASLAFSCTASPCSSAANWVGGLFLGLSGAACENAASGTLLTLTGASQNAAFAINGTTIEFGATFAAMGVSTSFGVRPYTTTNFANNANLNMSALTAYNALTVGPTAARVSALAARVESGGVTVGWLTHAEAGNLGFYVWRQRDGAWTRLGEELIPGQPSSFGVRVYRYRDADGRAGDGYAVTDVDRHAGADRHWGVVRASADAVLPSGGGPRRPRVAPPGPTTSSGGAQVLRLGVTHEGIYRIDAAAVAAIAGAAPRGPLLTRAGRPVGLEATSGGWLFYAPPVENAYDGVDAYLLELGPTMGGPSRRAPNMRAQPMETVVRGHERFKQFRAYDWFTDGDDPYFWTWSSNLFPVDPAVFDAPAVLPREAASVVLRLVGGTPFAHHVQIQLNGLTLGEVRWVGTGAQQFEATVPPGTLLPLGNSLAVVTVFDTGAPYEFVLLDWLEVSYGRAPAAVAGEARFELPSGRCTQLSGFGPDAAAWDVTDSLRPAGTHGADASGNLIACSAADGRAHRFEVFDPTATSVPSLRPAERVDLRDRKLEADEVLIVHPSLRAEVEPLVAARAAQGLLVKVVSLTQVYDSFGFGNEGREPLRQFLRVAHERWRKPPRYVLLVGAANADVRDVLATGASNLIPTGVAVAGPNQMRAASDSWFVAGEDGVTPFAAIGRLAVDTPADAASVISKLLAADVQGGPTGSALLAADISVQADDADFSMASQIVGGRLSEAGVQPVHLSAADPGAASTLAAVLEQGVDLWHYVGHAGTSTWGTRGWLNAAQVSALQNHRFPLLTSFDCLDGMFDNPTSVALGWAAVSNPTGGALGSFVPSTVLDPREGHAFDLIVTQALASPRRGQRVGDALLWAQQRAAREVPLHDFVRTYNLLGDPASMNPLLR